MSNSQTQVKKEILQYEPKSCKCGSILKIAYYHILNTPLCHINHIVIEYKPIIVGNTSALFSRYDDPTQICFCVRSLVMIDCKSTSWVKDDEDINCIKCYDIKITEPWLVHIANLWTINTLQYIKWKKNESKI